MSSSKEKNQLRAAIHYAIGKKCQDLENDAEHQETPPGPFTKGFIALLAETATETLELFARDVEAFSRHGKRSTVNTDDVKLLCRRNPGLLEVLEKRFSKEKQTSTGDKPTKSNSSTSSTKRKSNIIIEQDDDDDEMLMNV